MIFPFSSPKLQHKQWPHYNKLINIIKTKHSNFDIFIAPGPKELEMGKNLGGIIIKNDSRALNILELAGLIKKSSFIISNDTFLKTQISKLQISSVQSFIFLIVMFIAFSTV